MFRSSSSKWIIGIVVILAVLGLLRFKPWRRGNTGARPELAVGFLPVT